MSKHDEAILLLAILLKSEVEKAIGNAAITVLQEYAGEITVEEILETVQRSMAKVRTRSEYAKLILEAGRE